MKKYIAIFLTLACVFSLNACDNKKGQDYLNARVVEINETEIIVECIDESTNQFAGTTIGVSNEVISADGIPQIEVGKEIRIVFDNDKVNKLNDPVKIEHVYAIYLLDENGN